MESIEQSDTYTRSFITAFALAVAGIIGATVLTTPFFVLDPRLAADPTETSELLRFAFFAANFLGFFLVGWLYLRWKGESIRAVGIAMPTKRGWMYALAGLIATIGLLMAVNILATIFDPPTTSNEIIAYLGTDPNMVLIMLVVVFLFNAPAEEFLFRGVIQRRLYASFTRTQAIVVTSVLFAIIHLPAYGLAADGSLEPAVAIAISTSIVFGGSIILGYVYAKTDNLVVPTVTHAVYNGLQFGLLYLVFVYGDEDDIDTVMSTILEAGSLIVLW